MTAGWEKGFTDEASGTLARRGARERHSVRIGDALVITKLDGVGRSVRNLKPLADDL
jgi:hypothetical protein